MGCEEVDLKLESGEKYGTFAAQWLGRDEKGSRQGLLPSEISEASVRKR
jgi:hypothetical protein